VEEDSYRQSRLCRLLGNPVAFAVVELLANNNELNPSEISRTVGQSVQRVSSVLGALRLAEVVWYDGDGKRNRYRLKHPAGGPERSRLAFPFREGRFGGGRARPLAAVSFPRFRNSGNVEVWPDRIRERQIVSV
jgi:DNA-binding transcriptional ArsR family regulator